MLGGRLVQLQGFDSEHFAARTEQRLLYPTTIPATRGSIIDRDGQPLAYSVAARTIFADPTEVTDRIGTATALAHEAEDDGARRCCRCCPSRTPGTSRWPATCPRPEAAEVLALNLRGIGVEDTSQRIYPGHDLAAAVVGYTNDEGGLGGVESKFDGVLRGTDGRLEVERGSNGLQIPGGLRQETAAVPGSTVQLTLDQDLQYQLQNGLVAAVQKAKASSGQAVILDAHTGEVLAMATAPTYDAQNPSKSPPANRTNPVVQAPVEPGSANKVVTFSAAVEHKKITPTTPMLVPDSIRVADHVVHDAWYHAPEHWTATGVLAKSSNVGTLMIAKNLVGPAQFYDTERKFGIGQRTGIELPGESPGILPSPDTWSGTTFGNLPIGQGLSMTPLQLAGMYQTIANDGVRVQPRIVKAIIGPDGKATPTSAPQRTTVVSPQAARTRTDDARGRRGQGRDGAEGGHRRVPGGRQDRHRAAAEPGLQVLLGRRILGDVRRHGTGGQAGAGDVRGDHRAAGRRRGRVGRRPALPRRDVVRADRPQGAADGHARPEPEVVLWTRVAPRVRHHAAAAAPAAAAPPRRARDRARPAGSGPRCCRHRRHARLPAVRPGDLSPRCPAPARTAPVRRRGRGGRRGRRAHRPGRAPSWPRPPGSRCWSSTDPRARARCAVRGRIYGDPTGGCSCSA